MSCLLKTSSEYDRVNGLIVETVSLLCKNGLPFSKQLKVQGVLAVTIDENEIFLVHINEDIEADECNNCLRPSLDHMHAKNCTTLDGQLCSEDEEDADGYEEKLENVSFEGGIPRQDNNYKGNNDDIFYIAENDDNQNDVKGGLCSGTRIEEDNVGEARRIKNTKITTNNANSNANNSNNNNTDDVSHLGVDIKATRGGGINSLPHTHNTVFKVKTEVAYVESGDESHLNTRPPPHNHLTNTSHSILTNNTTILSPPPHSTDTVPFNNNSNSLSEHLSNTLFHNNYLNAQNLNFNNITYHFQDQPNNFQTQHQLCQSASPRKRRGGFVDTRPFACPVQGCDRRFFHRNNVYRHRKQKHYI